MTAKIITIAQQKGGSGKTTLAANLAVAFSAAGRKTAILDTDPQGSLGRWFMARADRMGDDEAGVTFKTASAWGAKFEARTLAKDHDLIIIDTPPKMGIDGRPSIQTADLVVVPINASKLDIWATEPVIEMAADENKPALMVLNRIVARSRITGKMREIVDGFGCGCAATPLGNRVLFAEALGEGYAVTEKRAGNPAAAEIDALALEIARMLGWRTV